MSLPPHEPGAYMLIHVPTGRFYIGSSGDLYNRYFDHRKMLQTGTHRNPRLQEVFTSWDDIEFRCEVYEDKEAALDREHELLNSFDKDPLFCNLSRDSRVAWGNGMPDSVRQKISAFHKGRDYGDEFRLMRSRLMTGVPRTEQQKLKLSESLRGRPRDPEIGRRISASKKGWAPSDETRSRMSESAKTREIDPSKIEAMKAAISIKVSIDGVIYPSISDAARSLGIPGTTCKQRIQSKSDRFKNWQFAE